MNNEFAAERVIRPYGKIIFWGILFSILLFPIAPLILLIQGLRVYFIIKANRDDVLPIYSDGETLFCYNGKEQLEIPLQDFCGAKGKLKTYHHFYGRFETWGTYNYGKIKIRYVDDGALRKFVVKNVLDAEDQALRLMEYAEDCERRAGFTDHYKILRVRSDATEQEIFDAYQRLKEQFPENEEEITAAFEVLSSPQRRSDFDKKYGALYRD